MSYKSQQTELTGKFGQEKQCSMEVYILDSHDVNYGNRNIIRKTFTGGLEELEFFLGIALSEFPNSKVELYINQYRVKLESIEKMVEIP